MIGMTAQSTFSRGAVVYFAMGITRMGQLTHVKSYGRYRSAHRRALVRRSLELLDGADETRISYAEIARRTGVPASTLRDWGRRREQHHDWTPMNTMWGQHRRIFTFQEEQAIAEFIRSEVLLPGYVFQNSDFRVIAMAAWFEKYGPHERIRPFNGSTGYISSFKSRHRFTSRAFHYKRRPCVSAEQASHWTDQIRELLRTVPHGHVLNTDETSWLLWPRGILTWTERDSDHPHVLIRGDEKENLTALATVTAAGERLPLFFLARGKTERVERSQIGDVAPHWVAHSVSGWMTEDTFEQYLGLLRHHYADGSELHLLLDSYSAHRTQNIKDTAARLGINLHFIPPGMTDQFQPLDRKVFGVLKASAKSLFFRRVNKNPDVKRTKSDAVQDLISAWTNLADTTIEKAWDIYMPSA
jgi:transposase-like protein